MHRIIDVIRFYNEYDFLELRLKFLKKEFVEIYQKFQTEAYIATTSNTGKKNNINLKILEKLKKNYNFDYTLYDIPKQYSSSCSRSAEDYCFDFINNSIKKRNFLKDNTLIAWSDLDEVFDLNTFNMSFQKIKEYSFCYTNMYSCFYNSRFCFNENWPGTIFFTSQCKLSLGVLKYSAHHSLPKMNQVRSGYHLSYFKGSAESKNLNSHFIEFFKFRLILAKLGIHPQLRYAYHIKNLYPNKNYKLFKELEYKDNFTFKLLRNYFTGNIFISYLLIFIIKIIKVFSFSIKNNIKKIF